MVDGFSCMLDIPKFSGGGPAYPPYKENTSIKPSKSFNNNSQRQKKKKKKKPEIEKKEEGAGARSFLCDLFIGLFETLICAIAEDNICDNCFVSSWVLLYFLLCLWWW